MNCSLRKANVDSEEEGRQLDCKSKCFGTYHLNTLSVYRKNSK